MDGGRVDRSWLFPRATLMQRAATARSHDEGDRSLNRILRSLDEHDANSGGQESRGPRTGVDRASFSAAAEGGRSGSAASCGDIHYAATMNQSQFSCYTSMVLRNKHS